MSTVIATVLDLLVSLSCVFHDLCLFKTKNSILMFIFLVTRQFFFRGFCRVLTSQIGSKFAFRLHTFENSYKSLIHSIYSLTHCPATLFWVTLIVFRSNPTPPAPIAAPILETTQHSLFVDVIFFGAYG